MTKKKTPRKRDLPPLVDESIKLGGRLVNISRYEMPPDLPAPRTGLTGQQLADFLSPITNDERDEQALQGVWDE